MARCPAVETHRAKRDREVDSVARRWKTFYDGIITHEKVHGTHAREMVGQIIATSFGLTVKNDPKCRKIRGEVMKRVKAVYADYASKARVFDRAEMTAGGGIVAGAVSGWRVWRLARWVDRVGSEPIYNICSKL